MNLFTNYGTVYYNNKQHHKKNGRLVNKNTPTNPTGINADNDVYIYREGHSSDCLLCQSKAGDWISQIRVEN